MDTNIDEKKRILVVEDSQIQTLVLKRLLINNNYEVDTASNGEDGINYAKHFRPDLIISDINMPKMDGYEMCKYIKHDEDLKYIPVILLTQLSSPTDIIAGIKSKADTFINKPFSDSYLLYVINYYLSSIESQDITKSQFNILFNQAVDDLAQDIDISQVITFLFSTYEHKIFQSKEQLEIQSSLKTLNNELKKQINDLKLSEGIYQGIFISIPDIIYSLDKDGRFIYINEAVTRYGYTPCKLRERHFSEIFMPYCLDKDNKIIDVDFDLIIKGTNADKKYGIVDPFKDNLRRLLLKINVSKGQISQEMSNKEYIFVEVNSSGLYNIVPFEEKKIFIGSSGVIRDISCKMMKGSSYG